MKNLQILVCAGVMLVSSIQTATAGGILTNTNQSVDFLRNPARDGAIGLDGVYSNPAGVAFLPDGLHVAFNWQYAHQTRTIKSINPVFALGKKNGGETSKTFEGVADAPCIPSLQAAYNKGNWSWQVNLSVPGGGGKCEFADGLGSFERVVGNIAEMLKPLGALGYDMDGYMQGRQYYFGVQMGAAYKVLDNLSVYGGLRLLYGTATYRARISNIQVNTEAGYLDFGSFLQGASATVTNGLQQVAGGLEQVTYNMSQLEAAGATSLPQYQELSAMQQQLLAQQQQLTQTQQSMNALQKYSEGVNLLCNQSGLGIAPVVGVDYKTGRFNFAAKYEFKTQIRMKNESTVFEASEIAAVNKFRDGEEVNEDSPAQLALGVQWSPIDQVRVNAGWHHFFDKDANWYNNSQELLSHNSNEFLAGAEWDAGSKVTISAGAQLTRYGNTDEYINDMSFVVNSYSIGFGLSYRVSDVVTLKGAYFQTNYGNYNRTTSTEPLISDSFTRTNRVLGVGVELSL